MAYYVFKRCSAYLYVDKSFRAKVPIEEHTRVHPDLGLRLGYEGQNMNLSSLDVLMGLRLHLF
jgi:hypothetical protein